VNLNRETSLSMSRVKNSVEKLLPAGSFARNATVLTSGTAAAQAIIVLASPILTRLYSPEEFGVLAVFAAMLGIVTVVSGLRYETVIPLPRTDGSAANVLVLSLICVSAITTLLTLIVALFGQKIVATTQTPSLLSYLWLLPVGVALGGAYQSFNLWAIRKKAFSRIARTKFQQSIGMVATQIGMGLAQLGSVGLIIGHVVGQAAGLTVLIRKSLQESPLLLKQIRASRFHKLGLRYYKFPVYDTWAGLGNTASIQIPQLLFAALFNPAVSGIYLLANRVMNLPMNLIAQSVGQVFFSRASQAYRLGNLSSLVDEIFSILTRIIVAPFILFIFVAPSAFAVVFGEHWRVAGVYAGWISIWIIMQFIYAPLSFLFIVTEHPQENLYMQFILFTIRIVAVLTAYRFGNEITAVAAYSVSSAVVYGMGIFWVVCRHGKISPRKVSATLGKEFCLAGLLILPLLVFDQVSFIKLSPNMGALLTFALFALSMAGWIAIRGIPLLTHIRSKN